MGPSSNRIAERLQQMTAGQFIRTSLLAGLAAATSEMIFVLPIQAALGTSKILIFQSIARGVLGRAAFSDGFASAALGLFVHVLVSVVTAAIYLYAAVRRPALIRRPFLSGMAVGIVAYLVMNFVVIPLSAIGFHLPKSVFLGLVSFAIHLFAFGLPIALASKVLLPRSPSTKSDLFRLHRAHPTEIAELELHR